MLVWLYLLPILRLSRSAHILGVFPGASISHQRPFQAVWRELSLRGHKVTVISPNVLNDSTLTNLTEIDGKIGYEVFKKFDVRECLSHTSFSWVRLACYWDLYRISSEMQFTEPSVKSLIASEKKFDVIIVEAHYPSVYLFGARFKAPLIVLSSYGVLLNTHDAVGNPTHPVISPDMFITFDGKEVGFIDKLRSCMYNVLFRLYYYWHELPKANKFARKYLGDEMLHLEEVEKNISLVIVNSNHIINTPRPNVANLIEVNRLHIEKRKPLPNKIRVFLDSSHMGVVYFSLGSNIKSSTLPSTIRNKILGALGELPYNVLWKWETDNLPRKPKNVLIGKWLPQQDILAHPNVKVFVTQGGLQSMEEAILGGVPMVGLPFIADQFVNTRRFQEKGLGLVLDSKTMSKEDLKNVILEVAQNKKYKKEVLKAKSILTDDPLKGVDKAVWWIEYVIRHKGAPHLRSLAADMSFYEYFMVDVMIFFIVIIVLFCVLLVKSLCILNTLVFSKIKLKIA